MQNSQTRLSEETCRHVIGAVVAVFALSLFSEGRTELVAIFYVGATVFAAVLLLLGLMRNDRFIVSRYTKWYCVFVLFSLFNHIFFSIDRSLSGMMLFRITVIGILMWCVYNAVRLYHVEKHLVSGLSAGLILNVFILFGIIPVWFDPYYEGRFCGTVGNANVYANMIVAALVVIITCISADSSYGMVHLVAILSGFICMFSTGSRGGISIGVLLLGYLLFEWNKNAAKALRLELAGNTLGVRHIPQGKRRGRLARNVIFILLVAAMVFFFQADSVTGMLSSKIETFSGRFAEFLEFAQGGRGDASTQWRYQYAKEALGIFAARPLSGIGLDAFKSVNVGRYAHSNYLELLADVGILGFFIYYLGLCVLFHRVRASGYPLRNLFLFFILLRLASDLTIVSYYLRMTFVALAFIEAVLDRRTVPAVHPAMQVSRESLFKNAIGTRVPLFRRCESSQTTIHAGQRVLGQRASVHDRRPLC